MCSSQAGATQASERQGGAGGGVSGKASLPRREGLSSHVKSHTEHWRPKGGAQGRPQPEGLPRRLRFPGVGPTRTGGEQRPLCSPVPPASDCVGEAQ